MDFAPNMHCAPGVFFCVRYLSASHMSTVPIVGVGKERRTKIGPWGLLEQAATVTQATSRTTGPEPEDSQR